MYLKLIEWFRKRSLSCYLAGIVALCTVLVLALFYCMPVHKNLLKETCFIFRPGQSVRQLAFDLEKRGLLDHPYFFIILARVTGVSHHLQAGQYCVLPGMRVWQLNSNLAHGRTKIYTITFIEGWNFKQIREVLSESPALRHLIKHKSEPDVMQLIGHPQKRIEGYLFPTTYYFNWQASDVSILRRAYQYMQQYLLHVWENRQPGLPYQSSYQALIVASLIEKEAKVDEDRAKIASVIINRLNKGMRLQMDSTVIYASGKRNIKQITRADFFSVSPYNTYRKRGLPITPIAMPGAASIYAALHPLHTDYLYYAPDYAPEGHGRHVFSQYFSEHIRLLKHYYSRIHRKK